MTLITSTINLLIAHITMINGDPNGLGHSFEDTATHLMLADPIDKSVKSKRTSGGVLTSSALAGRDCTGINLHCYNPNEFKQFQEQKDELVMW